MTALIQLGWRLLTHSLCFPAPQEVLWHQPALLHAVRSTGLPVPLPPTVQDSPISTKTSASWLQLEAFITAAHQAWQRDVVHIYPACYILSLSSHVQGSSTPPATFHCSGNRHGASKQIQRRKPLRGVVQMIIGTLSWIILGLIKHCVIQGCLSLWDTDCQHD